MTKRWSSFEGQQLLQENWRNFLSEESETAKHLRDQGFVTGDHWEDAEGQEGDPQASNYPDVSHGLDSEDNTDSLKQVLTPILDAPQIQTLIDVIAQIAGDEGIMLELSLKGLNSEQDRIIDSAGTALILKAIAGFNLPDAKNTALIKALNYWGRVNSVKFTAPPAAAPAVANTTDPLDDTPQDTTAPDEPEPEPEPEPDPEPEPEPEPEQERTPLQNPDAPIMTLPVAGINNNNPDQAVQEPAQDDWVSSPPPIEMPPPSIAGPEGGTSDTGVNPWTGEEVEATPENAAAILISQHGPNSYDSKREIEQNKKVAVKAQELGAGLMFKNHRTGDLLYAPPWEKDDYGELTIPDKGSWRIIPVLPKNLRSRFAKLADFFSDQALLRLDHAKLADQVPDQAIKNMELYVDQMKKAFDELPTPRGDDPLQETYDRWQTIAGINQRVL
jgi:hypothetical protein